jgi:putative two-component system response regulator
MRQSSDTPPWNRNDQQTLLAIDDDPMTLSIIDAALRAEFRILAAQDGERGLYLSRRDPVPDLILLDLAMPGLDGYAVCQALREHPATRHVPVIFLTSHQDEFCEIRAFEHGATDYLSKPVGPKQLQIRVRAHLAFAQNQRLLERRVAERTQENEHLQQDLLDSLSRAAEFRDNETGQHVQRMSHYSRLLAQAADVDETTTELLFRAAPLHDVGKIGIPDRILLKPGPLTDEEFALVRQHPEIGAAILGGRESPLMSLARTVALTHHERWDGHGYPQGLDGESIPLEGRIVAIADVFDALTSERPYKAPWSTDEAIDWMREQRGQHFDPRLLDRFLDIQPEILDIKRKFADQPWLS